VTTNESPDHSPTEAEIAERLAAVDGVNGAAGHELEDPHLRELLRKRIAGDITSEEYRSLGLEHLRKQAQG